MAFDPLLPVDGSLIIAAELRSQLTGLHDEIAAIPAVTGATAEAGTAGGSGAQASASVSLSGGVLHFTFGIPAGPPGEVSQAQLSNDLANTQNATMQATLPLTSANSNIVNPLNLIVSSPPETMDVQAIATKLDELIQALRR